MTPVNFGIGNMVRIEIARSATKLCGVRNGLSVIPIAFEYALQIHKLLFQAG
jgi:hypothetical protein